MIDPEEAAIRVSRDISEFIDTQMEAKGIILPEAFVLAFVQIAFCMTKQIVEAINDRP